ncbi:hypothetical protein [Azonexus sp. IMCC34839]|uniref:hypothetical protein n=1 Tax=Azonexus sp. IMCC34839 TaxID=3133695 RepID=UPI00399C08B7
MHILQIVIKNTSTMDFTVPVLIEARCRRPNVRITVLYCVLDRHNILRQSQFWDRMFTEHDIQQVDFSNFLRPIFRPFEDLFRKFFSGSRADKIHFHEAWNFYLLNSKKKGRTGFVLYLIQEYGWRRLFSNLLQSTATLVENRVTAKVVDTNAILTRLSPDFVLFDNRSTTQFPGRDELYGWMYRHRVKVALLPHAPHLRDPVREFCAFDEKGESLPDFCDFWVPMKFGEPWRQVPDRRGQFQITGYPGLDSGWLERCKRGFGGKKVLARPSKKIRCLFVMRRYMPKGEVRPANLDPYIVDYQDVFGPLSALAQSFSTLGREVEVILKPHPANNYSMLAADMAHSGFSEWSISHDPMYPLLSEVDLVVGLFSTVLLIPAMAGIPTVLIRTGLQDIVHSEWPLLEELYTQLSYYVPGTEKLTPTLDRALAQVDSGVGNGDESHLRQYFPDKAIDNVLYRMLP